MDQGREGRDAGGRPRGGLVAYTPELADEIVANWLKRLREEAAHFPAHAERLEALIAHYSSGGGPGDTLLEAAKGLSLREANTLDDDVSNLYWWRADPNRRQMQPMQYPKHALNKRRLAADRQHRAEEKKREKSNPLHIDLD